MSECWKSATYLNLCISEHIHVWHVCRYQVSTGVNVVNDVLLRALLCSAHYVKIYNCQLTARRCATSTLTVAICISRSKDLSSVKNIKYNDKGVFQLVIINSKYTELWIIMVFISVFYWPLYPLSATLKRTFKKCRTCASLSCFYPS